MVGGDWTDHCSPWFDLEDCSGSLLGFTWTFLYSVMFQLHPYSFGGLAPSRPNELLHTFPILGYFSLTTLSTIGFGDMTPLTLQARYAAVAEGITGQFYMAILIARLVGMQMSHVGGQQVGVQLADRQVWNKLPDPVAEAVVALALERAGAVTARIGGVVRRPAALLYLGIIGVSAPEGARPDYQSVTLREADRVSTTVWWSGVDSNSRATC